MMRKVVLLDTLSLFFRAYHALPPLTRKGEEVGGTFGFVKMLLKIFKDTRPDYLIAFTDRGHSKRSEAYEGYKATRPKPTEELKRQIRLTEEVLRSLDIPLIALEGYEADDLIASFIRALQPHEDLSFIILTGDKDLLSLLRYKRTFVTLLRKGVTEFQSYDRFTFEREYGFPPELYPAYKSMVGDPSDNLRGVHGIGDKRAKRLIADALKSSSSLEETMSKLEELIASKGGDLQTFRMNLKLVTLRDDLELPEAPETILDKGRFKGVTERFKELMRELGFKSVLKSLGELNVAAKGERLSYRQTKLFS